MAGEQLRAIVQQVYEQMFNHGNMAVSHDLFAPEFVDHVSVHVPNQPTRGPHAAEWYISLVRSAFPDLHATVEGTVVEGDMIAVRVSWTGTQTGQLLYLPPSGKKVTVTGIDMACIRDGKLVEHWGGWNLADVMFQLGMLPGPEGTLE
jgi:predicted ester cyclase